MSYQIFVDDSVDVIMTTTQHATPSIELKAKNRGMGKAERDRYIDELKREIAEAQRNAHALIQQRDAVIAERDYADTELGTSRAERFELSRELADLSAERAKLREFLETQQATIAKARLSGSWSDIAIGVIQQLDEELTRARGFLEAAINERNGYLEGADVAERERDTALMRIRELEQRTTIATMGEEQPICNEVGWQHIAKLTAERDELKRELVMIDPLSS